ncbi:hypothetical protein [Stenotrophomonas maltophilia]|uniref:hypothetical protein n=1 Tax=Stenotrophomonas maltophilia TaxID=40324 RepID=UPI0015DE2627|nr:hypothetical protein [Stenotrophomonas maltophilia]
MHLAPRVRGQRLDARAHWVPGSTEPCDTNARLRHRNRRILAMHVTGECGLVAWHQQPAHVHAVAEGGHVVALADIVPVIPQEVIGQPFEVRLRERRGALHQPLPGCQFHRAGIRGCLQFRGLLQPGCEVCWIAVLPVADDAVGKRLGGRWPCHCGFIIHAS